MFFLHPKRELPGSLPEMRNVTEFWLRTGQTQGQAG